MSSLNIIKKYPELLELAYLSEREREHDLHAIFKRDIEDNCQFSFRGWRIYPIKTDGEIDMARLFKHLTCEEIMVENEDGTTYPKRVFEMARSQRLHWINHHVRELTPDNLDVFTKYSKLPLWHQILLRLHIHRLLPYNAVISMPMESVESLYATKQ